MSEAELLLLASEAFDRMWSLLQWWVSVSFGLLVVAYLASERIGTYLAILIPLLYTGFSFAIFGIVARNIGIVESVYSDLRALQVADVELTITAKYFMQGVGAVTSVVLPVTVIVTYIGVLGYFIHTYRKKNARENT